MQNKFAEICNKQLIILIGDWYSAGEPDAKVTFSTFFTASGKVTEGNEYSPAPGVRLRFLKKAAPRGK